MNPLVIFFIGLLVGWIIEWVIDWIYWRRNRTAAVVDVDTSSRSRVVELEQEVASYKHQLSVLQDDIARQNPKPPVRPSAHTAFDETLSAGLPVAAVLPVAAQPEPEDNFLDIAGITAAMVERLKEAGIHTFRQLGELRPTKLRALMAGYALPANAEVEMVKQARMASGMIKGPDDLKVIVGIGPVISGLLNNAGIFTFGELANCSAEELRELVGDRIQQLADEDKILAQARQLAQNSSRGG